VTFFRKNSNLFRNLRIDLFINSPISFTIYQFLVWKHILKTGLLKWVYYFYSLLLRKKGKNKNYVIILQTDLIKDLKDEFTQDDYYSSRLDKFRGAYQQTKASIKNFNSESQTKSQIFSSIKNIESIDERLSEIDGKYFLFK